MNLRRRLLITTLAVALPVTTVIYLVVSALRSNDAITALTNVMLSRITPAARATCEADPAAFGTDDGHQKVTPDDSPDAVPPPRGKPVPHPSELFVYDTEFIAQQLAPPFPDDFKRALRASSSPVSAPFVSSEGTGVQVAMWTDWNGSPCRVLLGRTRAKPYQTLVRCLIFIGLFATIFGVGMAVSAETWWRIGTLSRDVRQSAKGEFREFVEVKGHDEVSGLAAAFNEAVTDIRQGGVDLKDRGDAFTRLVAATTDETGPAFAQLTQHLTDLDRDATVSASARDHARKAIAASTMASSLIGNLAAAAKLKSREEPGTRKPVDLAAIVAHVTTQLDPAARAAHVTLDVTVPKTPVIVNVDSRLFEQVVSNVIDNAIRYNRPGGRASVSLSKIGGAFHLHVVDTGPGVSGEQFKKITGVRRFRGDERTLRRPDDIGLGLAIVREAADRYDITWTFHQPAGGGFQVELSGKTT
jgi:signal transduction histidine kinase